MIMLAVMVDMCDKDLCKAVVVFVVLEIKYVFEHVFLQVF